VITAILQGCLLLEHEHLFLPVDSSGLGIPSVACHWLGLACLSVSDEGCLHRRGSRSRGRQKGGFYEAPTEVGQAMNTNDANIDVVPTSLVGAKTIGRSLGYVILIRLDA
jgi:hypothetical protein